MKGCTDASLQCNLLYVTLTLPLAKRVRPPNGKKQASRYESVSLSTEVAQHGKYNLRATSSHRRQFESLRRRQNWTFLGHNFFIQSRVFSGIHPQITQICFRTILGIRSNVFQCGPLSPVMALYDSVRPTPMIADVPWGTDWLHHTKHTAAASGTAYITLRKFHDTKHRNG